MKAARYAIRYVCFDAEPQAQRRAKELCNFLSVSGLTFNVVLPDKDPAETMVKHPKQLRQLKEKLNQ